LAYFAYINIAIAPGDRHRPNTIITAFPNAKRHSSGAEFAQIETTTAGTLYNIKLAQIDVQNEVQILDGFL
jgi:uridine phosphorylase